MKTYQQIILIGLIWIGGISMKIYTKTGDKGQTSLVYGQRISKSDAQVEAYGTCDEANSMIGLALSHLMKEKFVGLDQLLELYHQVQTDLFHAGAELSTPTGKQVMWKLTEEAISSMETAIDTLDRELKPLKNFVLPGGHPAAAAFHVARTIVRRAERNTVALGDHVNPLALAYLNRLSDLLFVTARYVNVQLGIEEPILHQ